MNRRSLSGLCCAAALLTILPAAARAQAQPGVAPTEDAAAVARAARDYLEGFYEGDSTKIVRSVSPLVVKYGYYVPKGSSTYAGEAMSYAEMLDYVRGVKARGRPVPAGWPREVVLFEVLDQTAAAKVVAWWGTDYLHLARIDGRWMITQVIWQSPPKASP